MIRTKCPKCGCTAFRKGGLDIIKRKDIPEIIYKPRRICKNCGTKYTLEPELIRTHNTICIYCGSSHVNKRGTYKGVTKFFCTNCKKNFRDKYQDGIGAHISIQSRNEIIEYLNYEIPQKVIAENTGISKVTIGKISKELNKIRSYKLNEIETNIYNFCRGTTKNVKNIDIMEALNISESSIRVAIHNINKKVGYSCITNIHGIGYKFNKELIK